MFRLLIGSFFLLLAQSSLASGYTAQYSADKLREFCSEGLKCRESPSSCELREVASLSACLAYVSGFREGHFMGVADATGKGSKKQSQYSIEELYRKQSWFCLPGEVSSNQIAKIFLKYVGDHPEKLHRPAFEQLYEAMKVSFPCQ